MLLPQNLILYIFEPGRIYEYCDHPQHLYEVDLLCIAVFSLIHWGHFMQNHTFVVPAYGNSPYLEDCIQHLLKQTVPSQIIVTTSTPSDFIKNIAEKFGLPYHINSGEKGIAADWNFALCTATTPLITIAHQDDIYEADYAKTVINRFQKYGMDKVQIAFTDYTDIVNGRVRPFGLNALVKHTLLLPFLLGGSMKGRLLKKLILLFGDPICCPSVTFNKLMLRDFKFSTDYVVALDWLAWYQMAQRPGAFTYIRKKLVRHRIHTGSETTAQLNSGTRRREEQQLFELMWGKGFAKFLMRFYAAGHKENLQVLLTFSCSALVKLLIA